LSSILGLPVEDILPSEVTLSNETAFYRNDGGNVILDGVDLEVSLLGGILDFGARTFKTDAPYTFYAGGFYEKEYETEANFFLEIPGADLPFGLDTIEICIPFAGQDICFTVSYVGLNMELQTEVEVDAYGTINLPLDQSKEVLRYNETSSAHFTLVPFLLSNGVEFAFPIDLLSDADYEDLANQLGFDLRAILIDTSFTEQIHRFYTPGERYPVATANVVSDEITSIEFLIPPPDLTSEFTSQISQSNCRQFTFASIGEGVPSTFEWDFGDGSTSNEENPIHKFESSGTYSVSLTVTDDFGGSTTSSADFEVDCAPLEASATYTVDAETCSKFTFTNTTDIYNFSSILWNFGDTNTFSQTAGDTVTVVEHTYGEPGNYDVTLTINNFGVENSSVVIPVAAGCDTEPVGLEDITDQSKMKVFPNPVADRLNIQLNDAIPTNSQWAIVDGAGKVVMQENINQNQNMWSVNVKSLPQGMYLFTVTDLQENQLFFKKFIIER